jgi:spoIIIJ-associated protein
MNAHDRRIIHITLKNDHYLTTKSQGNGYLKKVIIIPKKFNQES